MTVIKDKDGEYDEKKNGRDSMSIYIKKTMNNENDIEDV